MNVRWKEREQKVLKSFNDQLPILSVHDKCQNVINLHSLIKLIKTTVIGNEKSF